MIRYVEQNKREGVKTILLKDIFSAFLNCKRTLCRMRELNGQLSKLSGTKIIFLKHNFMRHPMVLLITLPWQQNDCNSVNSRIYTILNYIYIFSRQSEV